MPLNRPIIAALLVLMSTQAMVVAGAFSIPVLAQEVSTDVGIPVTLVGFYGSILFGLAALSTQVSAWLVNRYGGVRVSQLTMATTALGLAIAATNPVIGAAVGAALFGFSYGQSNTASGTLLNGLPLGRSRNFVFSLKQSAVPLGGIVAGSGLPLLATLYDWRAAFWLLALLAAVVCLAIEPYARLSRHADCRQDGKCAESVRQGLAPTFGWRLLLVFFALSSVQLGLGVTFVPLFPEALAFSPSLAAPAFSAAMLAAILCRLILGFAADRLGADRIVKAVQAGILISLILLLIVQGWLALLIATICLTVAFSWNGVVLSEVARTSADPARATSRVMTLFFLSGAIAPLLLGAIAEALGGLKLGFLVLAALCALSLLFGRRP